MIYCMYYLNIFNNFYFYFVSTDNTLILGFKTNLQLAITVKNSGENAYLTQVVVNLPKGINLKNVNSTCVHNSSNVIVCFVENPLRKNKEVHGF